MQVLLGISWSGVDRHKALTLTGCACAGEHGLFVVGAGVPVFLAPLEAYMTGVRVKLVQWSDRLLAEARTLSLPTHAAPVCTPAADGRRAVGACALPASRAHQTTGFL